MSQKTPDDWSDLEAEVMKQAFQESRPAVPKHVVLGLWRHWLRVAPDDPLFDDEDDDLALVLHARAYGLRPSGGSSRPSRLAELLDQDERCRHLTPEQHAWGPSAALAHEIRAALPSMLVRAWVAVDNTGPVEVIVVGHGLPEVRQQVVQAALTTSLRLNALIDAESGDLVSDLIGVGMIRISTAVTGGAGILDVPSVFDARHTTLPERSVPTARGVLRDFVTLLRSLQRETDLVQVNEVQHAELVSFTYAMRDLADRAAEEPDTAFLYPASGADAGVVVLLPYLRTIHDGDVHGRYDLGLPLSPDLLETELYLRLEQAHSRVLAERLVMDARLRRDRLLEDISWMRREKESFEEATPDERKATWPATVLLVERFDEKVGVSVRLASPDEIPTEVYFEKNVPYLIRVREEWAERTSALITALETAVNRPQAPIRQLAVGRFLDAVLRGAVPDESPATAHAFERWAADVGPMVWFEWRVALANGGVNMADLFTRHTVLVTRYLPAVDGEDAVFQVHPYTLVDSTRSAVLADRERGVLVVRDATDDARPLVPSEEDEQRAAIAWDELVRLAEDSPNTGENPFIPAFLNALRTHPRHIVTRLIEALRPEEVLASEADVVTEELRHARRAAALYQGMERAQVAMRMSAFRTARECLDNLPGVSLWAEARAWLLRAVVECVASEMRYREIPSVLGERMAGLPSAAEYAVDQAVNLDATFTEQWLRALPDIELDKGIRRLFHGLPKARASCSEQEYAALLFWQAISSVRLARQLEKSAEELSEESEAADTALVKLGDVLEEILLGEDIGGSWGQAQDLFVLLNGQEPPAYGRLEVR